MEENKSASAGEIIVYQPNEDIKLEVVIKKETIWLKQEQIAQLFGVKQPAISKHLKNIYASGELEEASTYSILEYMGNDGQQMYKTKLYNLDAILSVGYRVNSKNATHFRQWANTILKEYILKGYSVNQRFEALEERVYETEKKIDFFVQTSLPPVQGIFYNGQIFDAYKFANDLIRSANKRIILIDNYIDDTVLTMFDKRKEQVEATIYTAQISKQLQLDIAKHNEQYRPVEVQIFRQSHDRFLIIDDVVYLIGASLKDLGKKMFAFSKLEICADEFINQLQISEKR